MVHVVLFREGTRPVGMWRSLSAPAAMATLAAFVVLCILFTRWWERRGYRHGAEWLLRRLGG